MRSPASWTGPTSTTAISMIEREPEPQDLDEHDRRVEPVAEIEPERGPEPDLEPAPIQPDLEEEPEEESVPESSEPATVVGTYNSGDNKYVMFSDGSIEAQTPSGVFRFKSLDELKEFIAAGGEGDCIVLYLNRGDSARKSSVAASPIHSKATISVVTQ